MIVKELIKKEPKGLVARAFAFSEKAHGGQKRKTGDPYFTHAVAAANILAESSGSPVVKWAGGKQWLATAAKQLVPKDWSGRYFEPFLGGGSFFFSLQPNSAVLSDRNEKLIAMYRALRDDARGIVRLLSTYPYEEDFYYRIRSRTPMSNRSAAAKFLYLNRSCWNGLYRVNRKGEFNTPFGRYTNPRICDRDRILEPSKFLKSATLKFCDFQKAVAEAKANDLVYFDPPYVTGHENNGFLKYNVRLFSWADQERLAQTAIRLMNAGVHVLVSNANFQAVVKLYKGFRYFRIRRQSLIGGKGSRRGLTTEALLSSYPILGCNSEVIK